MTDLLHPSERDFDLALLDTPTEALGAHLAACAECSARFDRLRAELQAFRSGDEPARAARIISDRVAQRAWHRRLRRWAWLPTLGAAATAALIFSLRPSPEVRTKGGPRLSVYLRGVAGPLLWDGTPLHADQQVQLEVETTSRGQASIFTVDKACVVVREDVLPVEHARLVPHSWTLRGNEGGERLYAAFAAQPVEAGELDAALRNAGACKSGLAPDLVTKGFVARGVVLRKMVQP
jgi:hypothetical protein